jgi:EmrB/QacA subfamily drug resistance transporter
MQAMKKKPLILLSLLLAALVINLDTTMVNVALPTLVRELHATNTQLQWVVDAYNLVFAALLLTAGSLSDRFGRKGWLLAGLAVFGVASTTGGLATSVGGLVASRAFMGLGAAMIFPPTLSLISNVFVERKERAKAIGLWGATVGLAVGTGPIVGGWLLQHFSWSSIFYAMGPVAAVTFIMVALTVPRSRHPVEGRVDLPGFAISAVAMGLIVYTLIEAPTYGWSSGRSLGGYVGFALLAAGFVAWERRVEHPMLDVAIFKNMRFTAASGSVAIAFFGLFGFSLLITQYFQFAHGWSALSTGVHLLPIAFAVAVGSIVGTQMAVKVGTKVIVTSGLVMVTAFYVWIALSLDPTTSYAVIAGQMVIGGIGLGFTSAPATESVMGAVSISQAGVGSAVNDSTRLIGGTLGVAVIGSVFNSVFTNDIGRHLAPSAKAAFGSTVRESAGAAFAVSKKLAASGHPALGAQVHQVASDAFIHGFHVGCLVAAGVAGFGVLLAAAFLPAQPLVLAVDLEFKAVDKLRNELVEVGT